MSDPLEIAKNNWRILSLSLLLIASMYFLFVPGAPISGGAADAGENQSHAIGSGPDEMTNLQYGIELDGGARLTAPVEGMHVPEAGVTTDNQDEVRAEVAAAMDVDEGEIRTFTQDERPQGESSFPSGTVEVRVEGNRSAFVRGLQNAGLDVSEGDVRDGVTRHTRQRIVQVLDTRLGESGFSGGSVTQTQGSGEPRIAVEAPGEDIDSIEEIVSDRGQVQIVAHYPADNEQGYERQVVLRQQDMQTGTVQRDQDTGEPFVSITTTDDGAERMAQIMRDSGIATNPQSCGVPAGEEPGPNAYCIMTVVDGEIIRAAGPTTGLAEQFRSGQFEEAKSYRASTSSLEEAQNLRLNLISGALPAKLDIDQTNEFLFNPELAGNFKINSLITGIIAVLMVVLMVFLRYGRPKVAAPMAATALSELVILLGFAAAIGWPLDLAVVAGFVAVVGTGVDDLIIIADEVMSEGDVRSQHVFDSRFKKAFIVIGMAAATTIIAMAPLAILDLGELRGFAIVTILGVLIGVGISRPAYGNILRSLQTQGKGGET